jgi:two-component system, OmpR family, phosphate regulon response regulator PhoB
MTRILLVEDDRSLGATLRDRLRKEGYEVTWTETKRDSLAEHHKSAFDLYIFDVGLSDGTGFELAREIQKSGHRPFLFLTAQSDAESRLAGYELGAEEFIPKPFHLRELLLRVKHVLENHAPAQVLEVGDIRVDFESYKFFRLGQAEAVASKDLQMLKLLVDQSPKVVSRDEALNLLWGEDKFPTPRTVDNAILRLRAALGEDLSPAIESVRGVGYRWNPRQENK